MSCCASCDQQGMGWLGLGEPWAISDYVVAGSVIAWGGYIRDAAGTSRWSDVVEGNLKEALWNTGGFSWVDAGQISGWVNQYVSIKVTPKVDFAHLGDVFRVIEGAIYQIGFRPQSEAFWVESVPASAARREDIAKAGTGGSTNPGPTTTQGSGWPAISLPNLPDIFGGSNGQSNNGNPIDRLANWLGVGQTEAALIGVGLGIGAVVLVKRLL